MKRKNTTRNALFTSIISLLLCVSMLVGTTFAWFTDTASSGLNQIIAGNLDVELLYKDGDAYKNAADVKLFDDVELWEPGMVVYETVKIANVGNLALKYAIKINTGNENTLNGHGLSEVLHFAVIDGEIAKTLSRAEVLAMAEDSADKGVLTSYTFNNRFSLEADTESNPMTLIVYWPENGGLDNLYNANNGQTTSDGQALHIDLGLTVYASQETVEKDSFDEYYDDTASYPQNMWLGDVAEALVIDEETKTISISSGAELAKLAEVVNAGTDYAGYTVKLTDSIDLGNIAWTPIGGEKALKADVDGQGNTIYNLNVTSETYAALFGRIHTASITGVNVVNATVSGSHWVGAVVGSIYGSVTDCSVTNAKIIATPNVSGDSYDNGDKVGGIVGQVNEGSYSVTGNEATNVYLKAYRDVGGIAGMVQYGATVDNNTVENIEIVVDQAANAYGDKDFNAGGIVGRTSTKGDLVVTIGTNTETDVTISYVVATETALRNAMAMGGSVTLGTDVAVDADTTIAVPAGAVVELDLNGHKISATADKTGNQELFLVKGNMTVKNGSLEFTAGNNQGWNAMATIFDVTAGGVLNMEGVTANISGTDMNFIVHLNNWGSATLNVNNCDFTTTYCAVRAFNSGYDMNTVTIKDTDFHGGRMFWVHNYTSEGKDDSTLTLDIYGNGNTTDHEKPVRFGFSNSVYYTIDGMQIVSSATDLSAAVAAGGDVVLAEDLTVTGSVMTTNGVTEAYGNKVGVAQYGGTLDGDGNTLTETGTSAYVIVTHGGTIKNLNIVGGGRGIVIYAPTEDVIIDNVVIDGPGYAINTAEHNGQDLIVTNSTIKGWTSLAGLDSISFTNCLFGENSTKCWQNSGYPQDYDRLVRPYGQATFTGCTFEKDFYIDLSALAQGNMITLANCNCEDVVLTAENYTDYITIELPSWASSLADCVTFN